MADPSSPLDPFRSTPKVDFTKNINLSNVKGKSVIVTGGANGIGAGCAAAFAAAGAYVTILDINSESGGAVAKDLTDKGYHVQFTPTDMTSFSSQTSGFLSALAFSPTHTLDIIVCSAGVTGANIQTWLNTQSTSSTSLPEAPKTAALDVNLTGVFYNIHLALYYFRQSCTSSAGGGGGGGGGGGERGAGSKQIILVSSLAGYVPLNNSLEYQGSKYGVRGLFKALRNSVHILDPGMPTAGSHDEGASTFESTYPLLRTNLIAPTFIHTDMTSHYGTMLESLGITLGEIGDVVAGVMRVACDEEVSGRAIATVKGKSETGDRNFDLGDDWIGEGQDKLLEEARSGSLIGVGKMGRMGYERTQVQGWSG
ncbi:hypothetical protein BCR34DRAFT_597993 [Clohesyomyces aquaticus]|uniref:NAD(P)-binding protein n=1 Tax=Clohesyomyces aquaticus TaxID=1231657 RepID=A0A1Y2A0V8_9PLEO|nr:hypothetical protein BCR34DRAFT_597993 [Clohesyomyces aquaticus]